jgi:hypothetical protein
MAINGETGVCGAVRTIEESFEDAADSEDAAAELWQLYTVADALAALHDAEYSYAFSTDMDNGGAAWLEDVRDAYVARAAIAAAEKEEG